MAGATVRIEFDLAPIAEKLKLCQTAISKLDTLAKSMEAALKPTADMAGRFVQQPGFPGYTPRQGARKTKPKLFQQMRVTSRIYPRKKVIVGVAGPKWPQGAHGQLVELGHRIASGSGKGRQLKVQQAKGWTNELVWSTKLRTMIYKHGAPKRNKIGARIVASGGFVQPKPFLAPATEATKGSAQAKFEEAVGKFVDDACKVMNG